MKTLVLTQNFPPASGGSGRWFWELYSRLGNDYIIAADEMAKADSFDASAPITIHRLPLYSSQWGIANLHGLKYYWRSFKALKQLVKEQNIDYIHCGRVLPEGLMAWMLKKTLGIPYLCYVHGEDLEASALSRELNSLTKLVMRSADKIICNSHNSANIVNRVDDSVNHKVTVMHPGADTSRFSPIDKKDEDFLNSMGWQGKRVILTVGRLQARKGQDKMIQAMPEIVKRCPQAHYVIIGHGESRAHLEQLIASMALHEHVQLLTDCDDETMIKCYQHCDVFILPNRTEGQDIEGFGMVLVEAQACAKPVIAGDSGGTKETLIPGETGDIVDATDTVALADVIIKFIEDPDRCEAYGSAGRKHSVQAFDWENAAINARSVFVRN